jgi:protein TonB
VDSAPVEAPKRESAVSRRPPGVAAPKAAAPAHQAPTPEPDTAAPLDTPRAAEAVAGERADVALASPPAAALKVDAAPAAASDSSASLAGPAAAPPDLGSLAQYRLALIGAAKRHKTYPPRAIDRGLEGRVDVRLVVGTDGGPARVLVRRSSGHDVLDRQALELMRTASALTPVPPALRNREFAVEVPILYELKDER